MKLVEPKLSPPISGSTYTPSNVQTVGTATCALLTHSQMLAGFSPSAALRSLPRAAPNERTPDGQRGSRETCSRFCAINRFYDGRGYLLENALCRGSNRPGLYFPAPDL